MNRQSLSLLIATSFLGAQADAQKTATRFLDTVVGVPGDELGAVVAVADVVPGGGAERIYSAPGTDKLTIEHDGGPTVLTHGGSGLENDSRFGAAFAIGDVTGDGAPDIVVGAPEYGASRGALYVFPGPDFDSFDFVPGDQDGDLLGTSVAIVDDTDGDGEDDFAAGAPGFVSFPSPNTGQIRFYSTTVSGTAELPGQEINAITGERMLGRELLFGNFRGDSSGDLAIGLTAASGTDLVLLLEGPNLQTGLSCSTQFAAHMANAGDVTGSSHDDVIAVTTAGFPILGAGAPILITPNQIAPVCSTTLLLGAFPARTAVSVGDIDQDGDDDLGYGGVDGLVGVGFGLDANPIGATNLGEVFLLDLQQDEVEITSMAAGDLDDDGWPEIVIGSASGELVATMTIGVPFQEPSCEPCDQGCSVELSSLSIAPTAISESCVSPLYPAGCPEAQISIADSTNFLHFWVDAGGDAAGEDYLVLMGALTVPAPLVDCSTGYFDSLPGGGLMTWHLQNLGAFFLENPTTLDQDGRALMSATIDGGLFDPGLIGGEIEFCGFTFVDGSLRRGARPPFAVIVP